MPCTCDRNIHASIVLQKAQADTPHSTYYDEVLLSALEGIHCVHFDVSESFVLVVTVIVASRV